MQALPQAGYLNKEGSIMGDPIDLASPAFRANPYPTYEALRRAGGVHWLPHGGSTLGMWLITSYDGVGEILKRRQISKHAACGAAPAKRTAFDHNLLAQDPPDHTRVRELFIRAFTTERLQALRPGIMALIDELIDRMLERGEGDFVADFAMLLPAFVIADLLGVPREDRERFCEWSRNILIGPDVSNGDVSKFHAAAGGLTGYFHALVSQRRQSPRDDLISEVVRLCDEHGRISEEEMLATLILLLVAGHETTVNMLGNGLWLLLRSGQYETLKGNRDLLPSAIEEILRFESPVQRATFRVTTEKMVIGGVEIEQGQQVSAVIGSANRDGTQFTEADRFDIGRKHNRHIAFGAGIHACLGPALSRLEGKLAFERLVERAPNLRLLRPEADWNLAATAVRGLTSLPVRLR
ncbi:MAG: cytochrome P450 [Dongiaceae bacterium]